MMGPKEPLQPPCYRLGRGGSNVLALRRPEGLGGGPFRRLGSHHGGNRRDYL